MSAIPEGMPDLISGAGELPENGACVMQAVAWLSSDGKQWNDAPDCAHHVIRKVAIWINDTVDTKHRQELWPLVPRIIGTATGDRKTDVRIGIALAVWAAERVLPLIKDPVKGEKAAEYLGHARRWLDGQPMPAAAADVAGVDAAYAVAAAAADVAAAAAADADADADAAAAAAAYAVAADVAADVAAAYAVAAVAADVAAVAAAAAYAVAADADADAADTAKIRFLTELIDEYDRVTGRTEVPEIPEGTWEKFRAVLTG